MIVVIDGYNILRSLYTQPLVTDKERHEFTRRIVRYANKKKLDIKLVFDGGAYGMPDRTKMELVEVIFTGRKESADEWIIRYIEDHKGHELAIVSSDRELVVAAQQAGMLSVRAKEFHKLLRQALQQKKESATKSDVTVFRKFSSKESNKALDMLMINDEFVPIKDEVGILDVQENKRSKKERKRHQKLKKL